MRLQGLGAASAVALVLAGGAAAQDHDGALTAAERRAVDASGLPRAQVVSVKRDLVVAITSRGSTKGGVLFEGVALRGEAVNSEAARNLGYRSMRMSVNVDCGRRRDLVLRMTIFPEANGKGEPILRQTPGGWIQPSPGAFLSDVIASICNNAPGPSTPSPEPSARPASPPPKAVKVTPVAAPAPPVHEPAPEPEPEPVLVRADSETIATGIARRPRLPLAPPSQPLPVSPPPPVLRPATAPPPGGVVAQIVAVSTVRQAQDALEKIGRLPAPLGKTVQEAKVDGRTFYRALVTGFASRADAKLFCEVVVSYGGVCFVR
ncbi:SPOR domain-containing protein [Phenylobacterium sp.]|uniref:SPOR domain-containing protein n=1 Tax=Phenylobacterium sp. TaxID=1871053 RepID=UPI00273427E0|nr:SPOR domain-containing protein [Phenylobacterium sp.]MDP3855431.1 SPOR domain-containing protein [Phenylobacterium sp.]